MKYIVWPILVICLFGSPLMLAIFIQTWKPMALVNTVWSAGVIFWCITLLRMRT